MPPFAEMTTYGDVKNGDRVMIEGHVFTVSNVRRDLIRIGEVVRFEGALDASDELANSGYNGGTYGRLPDQPICRVIA